MRDFQSQPFTGKGRVVFTPTMRQWRKKQVTREEWESTTRQRMEQEGGNSPEQIQAFIDSVPDTGESGYYDAWGYEFDDGEEVPFEVETNPFEEVDVPLGEAMFTQVVEIEVPPADEEISVQDELNSWSDEELKTALQSEEAELHAVLAQELARRESTD